MVRGVGSSLHSISVAVTWGRHMCFVAWLWCWFALPNAARRYKRRLFLLHSSNYDPNSVAVRLHRTAKPELWTVCVMICHVSVLSHTDIYSIFLQLLKTHMAFWMLQFIVSNGNVTTVSGHAILHLAFLPPLLSGWNHKWYWVFSTQRFKTAV